VNANHNERFLKMCMPKQEKNLKIKKLMINHAPSKITIYIIKTQF
jgi:hypothetical protein